MTYYLRTSPAPLHIIRVHSDNMSAVIQPLGMLKSYVGEQKQVTVDVGKSVRETLLAIGINPDLVAGVFVNDEQQSKDYLVQDDDVIKVLAVIGGG